MINKIIRQDLGNNIVIGVSGHSEFVFEWEIIVKNYSLTGGKTFWLEPNFFYFITTPKRLENNLAICHQNKMAVSGELEKLGIEADGGWILARQKARREINTFIRENFYMRMSAERQKFKEEFGDFSVLE